MSPNLIFYTGVAICGVAVVGALIAMMVLRFSKARLNKKLDDEYGKWRYS